jgi:hypothetical protein
MNGRTDGTIAFSLRFIDISAEKAHQVQYFCDHTV